MAKKILITLNALKDNRGSEALVRGLIRICREKMPSCEITISSGARGDIQTDIPQADKMIPRRDNSSKINKTVAKVIRKITHDSCKAEKVYYKELLKAAKKSDVVFVIGADNYDSSYNMQPLMQQINSYIINATTGTTVMYDCSLEEKDLTDDVVLDMDRFKVITVRESITKLAFEKRFSNRKLKYYPDPAFVMQPEKCKLPEGFIEGKMVGINLSNLVTSGEYGADGTKLVNSYYKLIDYIVGQTNLNVILIPHVMGNADLSMLRKLYQKYIDCTRVMIIENEEYNAAQLKYIISKLSYLVTARTHASIAAYSTCVPTLVLGYSVKSIGIATDLFGTTDGYVVSTNQITTEMELVDHFKWLVENGCNIRKHLEQVIPKYQSNVMSTGEILEI